MHAESRSLVLAWALTLGWRGRRAMPMLFAADTQTKQPFRTQLRSPIPAGLLQGYLLTVLHFNGFAQSNAKCLNDKQRCFCHSPWKAFPDSLNFITPTPIPCSTLNSSSSRHKAINYSTHGEVFNLLDKWVSVRWQSSYGWFYPLYPKSKTTSFQQVLLLPEQQYRNQEQFSAQQIASSWISQLLEHFPHNASDCPISYL